MTLFDSCDKIKKSSGTADETGFKIKVSKKEKKCLTERVKHDKIIKSLKQVTQKFFEN